MNNFKAVFLLALLATLSHTTAWASRADSIKVVLTEGTNMAMALSPDKKSLALDIQGTIWSVPVAGGTAKALTDPMGDCRQPDWSPDGERVVFHSYRDGNFHLWSVRKDGSNLSKSPSGPSTTASPTMHPTARPSFFPPIGRATTISGKWR